MTTIRVGGFPLAASSLDAVVLTSFAPGTYIATATGVGGATGRMLLEIYDADPASPGTVH